jgi:hypothetical protein
MPAIFVSHSSHDGRIADDIKSALAGMGFERVFLDFDKDTGIDAARIGRSGCMRSCRAVMPSSWS